MHFTKDQLSILKNLEDKRLTEFIRDAFKLGQDYRSAADWVIDSGGHGAEEIWSAYSEKEETFFKKFFPETAELL